MDSVRAFVDEVTELYGFDNWDDTFQSGYKLSGFDWIDARENDWDWRDVESEELEMRSAMEFLRPALTPSQLAILEKWDEKYQEWRDADIFFERYAEAHRSSKWSWRHQREYAEKTLGKPIPKSHWWYWPPEEGEEKTN